MKLVDNFVSVSLIFGILTLVVAPLMVTLQTLGSYGFAIMSKSHPYLAGLHEPQPQGSFPQVEQILQYAILLIIQGNK